VETVYVAMKNEGVEVWRPVESESLGDSLYRLGDAAGSEDEDWEFPAGSIVRCETRALADGHALVAVCRT
jgi:hypothetical protein